MPKIEHIIVLMMENHTFDNFLGMLPNQVKSRHKVDGLKVDKHGKVDELQSRRDGPAGPRDAFALAVSGPRRHRRAGTASHTSFNGGRNDGFVKARSRAGDAVLRPDRPAVLLLAGLDVPDRRALLLVGPRPDLPQPALPVLRDRQRQHRHRRLDVQHPRARTGRSSTASTPTGSRGRATTRRSPSWLIVPGALTQPRIDNNMAPISQFFIRRQGGQAAGVHVAGPAVRGPVAGEPAGHPGRRAVHGQGRQRGHELAQLADDGVLHQLRRGRRLLRPRPAARRRDARRHAADPRPERPAGRL